MVAGFAEVIDREETLVAASRFELTIPPRRNCESKLCSNLVLRGLAFVWGEFEQAYGSKRGAACHAGDDIALESGQMADRQGQQTENGAEGVQNQDRAALAIEKI